MVIIKADKHAVTIKEGGTKVVSYPLGTFIVRKTNNKEISLISTIGSDRFKCDLTQMVPSLTKNIKLEVPNKEDNKKGKEGDVWHSKKTGMYYLHDGKEYKTTSADRVIELFIHKLSSYLNGASYFE